MQIDLGIEFQHNQYPNTPQEEIIYCLFESPKYLFYETYSSLVASLLVVSKK